MTDFHDDFEARLRASLADQARGAPDPGPVSDQVLAAVENVVSFGAPERDHPRWRSWGLPLVAAAAVVAIVGGVVGVGHLHTDADPASNVRHSTPAPSPTVSTPPTPVSGTPSESVQSTGPATYALHNFRVRDLTFVAADEGWALGTADCLNGSGQTCTALAFSTDGTHWNAHGSTPFNVPGVQNCADPCVTNIRFANAQIGYAFGPAALYLTTDGAASWQRLPGGAAAMESLNGNVIRVTPQPAGCTAPGCSYAVQTAAIGGTTWQASSLTNAASTGMTTGVQLSRTSTAAVLVVFGHPAGGGSDATSAVYTSTNNGGSWTDHGEVCLQNGTGTTSEVDTTAVTTATDGTIAALCAPRGGANPFTEVSINAGQAWTPGDRLPAFATNVAAASALVQVVSGSVAYRTVKGGTSWQVISAGGGLPNLVWLGFESATTGRAVQTPTSGASTIWTTRDGGASWSATPLS